MVARSTKGQRSFEPQGLCPTATYLAQSIRVTIPAEGYGTNYVTEGSARRSSLRSGSRREAISACRNLRPTVHGASMVPERKLRTLKALGLKLLAATEGLRSPRI